ncbi:hypothetical protein [Streptomyces sp. NPDC054838]
MSCGFELREAGRVALGGSCFLGSGQADDNAFCTVKNPTPYFR